MPDWFNPLAVTDPADPNRGGNPLYSVPTPADAWTFNRDAAQDWIEQQRAISRERGLWNDTTGLPTQAGVVDAAQQYGSGVLMGTTAPGIRAFHGSPHSFERFSADKIGTGEGAQAYGHGLYTAESEGVARGYRDALAGFKLAFPNKGAEELFAALPASHQTLIQSRLQNGAKPAEIKTMLESLADGAKRHADYFTETGRRSADYGADGGFSAADAAGKLAAMRPIKSVSAGHMYEVNINANPEHFLDWDKPLSEQSKHVQEALAKTPWGKDYLKTSFKAGQIAPRTAEGAEELRAAGIPGVRYLDAGSRAEGAGTSNHVVFDASTIEILRKYGLAGLMAGAGGVAAASQAEAAPTPPPAPAPSWHDRWNDVLTRRGFKTIPKP